MTTLPAAFRMPSLFAGLRGLSADMIDALPVLSVALVLTTAIAGLI